MLESDVNTKPRIKKKIFWYIYAYSLGTQKHLPPKKKKKEKKESKNTREELKTLKKKGLLLLSNEAYTQELGDSYFSVKKGYLMDLLKGFLLVS